jgi:hypothetical protein
MGETGRRVVAAYTPERVAARLLEAVRLGFERGQSR